MRKKFIAISVILLPLLSFSQKDKISDHNSQLQAEVLGPGGLLSFHFESRFSKIVNGPGYTVGLGFAPYGLFEETCNTGGVITIPVGLNYLFGGFEHFLEIGVGGALKFGGGTKVFCLEAQDNFFESDESFYGYALLGYQYQPMTKSLCLRIFISPLFQKGIPVKLWGGAGISLRLRN